MSNNLLASFSLSDLNQAMFAGISLGIVYQNTDGAILAANPAALKILGVTLEQLQGRAPFDPHWRSIHEDGSDFPREDQPAAQAQRTGQTIQDVVMGVLNPQTNRYTWVNVSAIPQSNPNGAHPPMLMITIEDITERKYTNHQITQLNRLYATLSQINQAIVRTKSQTELFETICKVAIDFGKFRLAWIGLYDAQSGQVTPAASSHALPFRKINAHEKPFSLGLIATALQTGAIAFSNDIQTDPSMQHWHQVDILQAYHSVAAVPFSLNGNIFGVLSLYTADLDFFMAEQEKKLLEEIGLDISFALDTLVAENKHRQAEEQVARLLDRVQNELIERKRAEEKTDNQLRRLSALRAIDMAITSSLDLRVTLNVLLEQVTVQLQVDAAAVLLLDPNLNELKYAAGRGFRGSRFSRLRLKLGEGQAGKAALERRTICIPDLAANKQPFAQAELAADEIFAAFFAVPLVAKGQVKGVLEVFHRTRLEPDPQWLDFLETLAGQAAIAVDSAQLFDGLQRSNLELSMAYDTTIEGWSLAMDLRDKETEGHTRRVTELTIEMAVAAGMKSEQIAHVRRGALLHDMGKLGVPDAILHKPDDLTDEERSIMRKHPQYAYDMLSSIEYLRPALDIPYCHHEKWDGTGYPRGLKGEQIPPTARLFSVVDIWDALSSDRPYRKGWPQEKVMEYIRAQSGIHFDPKAVELFFQVMKARESQVKPDPG